MLVLNFLKIQFQEGVYLLYGINADAFIVSNKSGELFLIPSDSSGIEIVELTTVDKTRTSIEIIFKER